MGMANEALQLRAAGRFITGDACWRTVPSQTPSSPQLNVGPLCRRTRGTAETDLKNGGV